MAGYVIIDTNLLVLYVVGLTDTKYIRRHKRLNGFIEADFDVLSSMLASAQRVVVAVNVLTEASNLLAFIREPARTHIMQTFGQLITRHGDSYVPSKQAVERPEFIWLGLADAALLDLCSRGGMLLTADSRLYEAALRCGGRAEIFNSQQNFD
jgi:predicted nucleic acid-binding protein